VTISARESRIDEGRGCPPFQLPARSTATQKTSSAKSCRQEKRHIIHEGRKKLFDRKGCEAMKVGIIDAIQAKGAPHDHLLGEPH
jgi:hypothetical protein